MKLLAALLFGAASALQPAQVKSCRRRPPGGDEVHFPRGRRRGAWTGRRARGSAAAAPVDARRRCVMQSGQIKTGNAGSILPTRKRRRHS